MRWGWCWYEPLQAARPYRLKTGASLTALEQAVMQAQVQRPSTQVQPDTASARATTVEKLSRRLRGDLDAIALKGLERLPHESLSRGAEALADDVQHYLSGKPVEGTARASGLSADSIVLRHRAGVP